MSEKHVCRCMVCSPESAYDCCRYEADRDKLAKEVNALRAQVASLQQENIRQNHKLVEAQELSEFRRLDVERLKAENAALKKCTHEEGTDLWKECNSITELAEKQAADLAEALKKIKAGSFTQFTTPALGELNAMTIAKEALAKYAAQKESSANEPESETNKRQGEGK